MAKRDFTVLTEASLITCIVEKGQADTIVKAARSAGAQGEQFITLEDQA